MSDPSNPASSQPETVASSNDGGAPNAAPPQGAPDALIGRVVDGRLRVIRRIAEGGMGVVYEAEQLLLRRHVALKVLHVHLANDTDIEARFRKEALAATAIGHIGIVEVFDLGHLEDGRLYIVLELLDGLDLGKVLFREGPLPLGRTARILSQVCDALHAAHSKGIVHRDLKPENVLLVNRGSQGDVVKIVDFGVSKFAVPGLDSKTRTGTAVGTPYYMAPEQAQARSDVDHRADVYSLGVMLFRMLTGVHPFDDASYPMLVLKICTEAPPPLSRFRTSLPAGVQELCDRLLAKDPDQRPQSLREVKDELVRYAEDDRAPELTHAPSTRAALPQVLGPRPGVASSALDRTEAATPAHRGEVRKVDSPSVQTAPYPAEESPLVDNPKSDGPDDDVGAIPGASISNRTKFLIAAAGGLLTIGAGVFAYANRVEPAQQEEEPQGVALPQPMPESQRPMGIGGPGPGWGFLNPRPRVMPTWYAVANGGAGLVAMVGAQGSAARFFQGYMVTFRTGIESSLDGVAWTGPDEALAVGEFGVLLRLRQDAVTRLTSPTEVHLHAVVSLSSTEAYAVGDRGTILRVAGNNVLEVPSGTEEGLLGVTTRRGVTFVVGASGTVLRLDEGRVVSESVGGATLRAVGGCDDSDLYAVGDDARLLRRTRTGEWRSLDVRLQGRPALTAVGCNRGRAVVVGANGTAMLVSGNRTAVLPTSFAGTYTGVAGHADEATWLVGTGGRLAIVASDHLETRVGGAEASLRDIASLSGALVAVGDWGRIVRERENDFRAEDGPTSAALGSIAALSDGDLIAVGDEGSIVRIRYDGTTRFNVGTEAGLRGVVAGNSQVLAVGTGGTVVRGAFVAGNEPAWAVTRLDGEVDLHAVAGTPADAILVGSAGSVVHVNDRGTHRYNCEAAVPLYAVTQDRSGAFFAAGGRGVILRLTPEACIEEHAGGPDLHGLGNGPDGTLLAVGDSGAAWSRSADGTWQALDLDVGRIALRAVRRLGNAVYVVGAGGVILRHTVHDGT